MRWDIERLRRLKEMSTIKLNPLSLESVSQCRLCANLGTDHVPSEGSPRADVLIVGQSPGAQEVVQGRPFVGPSGELLDLMLDTADLERSDVYICNVLKCRPPGNRKALLGEMHNCKSMWLKKEIKAVDPRIVVILGNDAFRAVLPGRYWNDFTHGFRIKSKSGRVYLVSYHPSYFLRRGDTNTFVQFGEVLRKELDGQNT